QKVGEEAVELIIAASAQSWQRVIEKTSDLIYHRLVMLSDQGIGFDERERQIGHPDRREGRGYDSTRITTFPCFCPVST
ncbi:MAG: phosphoribosyl-ATP diphosphatase, partial [Chloroflexota bacterium]|nr:phosphoribosyl-ATP diphosphatase [Chloroflexota bacterium]